MKKTLVTLLALVFVLGIATTAFAAAAANPFVDVPAKHWAYGAVSKLAKAGVVDGYGDGTFRGDKTMTRYEMAQIVAKAMAKSDKADAELKALIDKLAVEFAAELNNLGVRVAKLEANASTIKFTGDARVRYVNANDANHTSAFTERFRLNMAATVNENTSFYGRLMIGHTEQGTVVGSSSPALVDASFTSKDVFGTGAALTLGRQSLTLGSTGYLYASTGMVDAFKVTMKLDTGSFFAGYGDFYGANKATAAGVANFHKAIFAGIIYPTSKATTFTLSYLDEVKLAGAAKTFKVQQVGVTTKLSPEFTFVGDYWKNSELTTDPKAYVLRVAYKGVNPKVQGSWGAWVEYYRAEAFAVPSSTDYNTGNQVNFANTAGDRKAWDLFVGTTLAKNITLEGFQTFQSKTISTGAKYPNYTRFQVNYMF